jgi:hypothetical protein
VTNVWKTQYRLLLERLETLPRKLREDEAIVSTALNEQTIRLLVGEVMLLRQHRLNKRDQW